MDEVIVLGSFVFTTTSHRVINFKPWIW